MRAAICYNAIPVLLLGNTAWMYGWLSAAIGSACPGESSSLMRAWSLMSVISIAFSLIESKERLFRDGVPVGRCATVVGTVVWQVTTATPASCRRTSIRRESGFWQCDPGLAASQGKPVCRQEAVVIDAIRSRIRVAIAQRCRHHQHLERQIT